MRIQRIISRNIKGNETMLPKETCEFIEQKLINVTDKVTVIVPVYNVSSFLSKCIESICGQEYPFLEIILVGEFSKKYRT